MPDGPYQHEGPTNYVPGQIGYFHESHNVSPFKAAKMIMKVASAHAKGNHKAKTGKGKSRGDRFMVRGPHGGGRGGKK